MVPQRGGRTTQGTVTTYLLSIVLHRTSIGVTHCMGTYSSWIDNTCYRPSINTTPSLGYSVLADQRGGRTDDTIKSETSYTLESRGVHNTYLTHNNNISRPTLLKILVVLNNEGPKQGREK